MSASPYVLKVTIDNSQIKDLEKRLSGMFGIKSGGGSGNQGGTGGGFINILGNLGKLGMIAAGVAGLVMLVKKIVGMLFEASPALQAIWKLFDTSIMLILRPIGDFIAFFLRPILSLFLRHSLTWYKLAQPFSAWLGNQAGNAVAKGLDAWLNPFRTTPNDPLFGNDGIFTSGAKQTQIRNGIAALMGLLGASGMKAINDFVTFIKGLSLGEAITGGLKKFKTFIATLGVTDKLAETFSNFKAFIAKLGISDALKEILSKFKGFIAGLKLTEKITAAVKGFMDFLAGIGVPKSITESVKNFMDFIASINVSEAIKKAIDTFFGFIKKLAEWINSLPDFIKNMIGLNSGNGGKSGTTSSGSAQKIDLNINIPGMVNSGIRQGTQAWNDAEKMIKDILAKASKGVW